MSHQNHLPDHSHATPGEISSGARRAVVLADDLGLDRATIEAIRNVSKGIKEHSDRLLAQPSTKSS